MKRAKRFAALALVASLVLGSTVFVYADEKVADDVTAVEEEVIEDEAVEEDVAEEVTADEAVEKDVAEDTAKDEKKAVVTEEVLYDDLKYETKLYFSDTQVLLGEYPAITGMDELNKKIKDTLWRTFYFTYSTESRTAYQGNNYQASFSVEDTNQFAKITLFLHFSSSSITLLDHEDYAEFFVDKAGMIEVGKEVYEKYLADREAAALEEEDSDEAILDEKDGKESEPGVVTSEPTGMLQARNVLIAEGYAINFDAEKNVYVVSDKDQESIVSFTVGVNEYVLADDVVELSSEPLLYEDRLYLPADFFTEIIGIQADDLPATKEAEPEMIPLAATAREAGYTVRWNAAEQRATLLLDDEIVAHVMPDTDVFIVPGSDGEDVENQMSAAAYLEEGTLFVPEDFFGLIG